MPPQLPRLKICHSWKQPSGRISIDPVPTPPNGRPLSWLTREMIVGIASCVGVPIAPFATVTGSALPEAGILSAANVAMGWEASDPERATVDVTAVALMNSRRLLVGFGFSDGVGFAEKCFSSEFMRKACD